ncbi:hypothetical protein HYV64_04550 [Candidatus Shapirobacteria bacterium]|nr:hypothetical protein [Candidatus Shapirobacteria bacterium]
MKNSTMIIFITYVWTKVLLGLVVHPYKSVREVSRHRVLLPVVLSPLYALIGLFLLGRIGSFLFEVSGFKRELISLVLSTGLISILLWQFLLLYLLLSFLLAFRRS